MSLYERYKTAEKQLVEALITIATDRCEESDLPTLLERRGQKYHDKTYPNLPPLSAAILKTCPKGASPPPQLKDALVLARNVVSLRREHKRILGNSADASHDTWLEILETVKADLECIRDHTWTGLRIDTRPVPETSQRSSVNMFASLSAQETISPPSAQSSNGSASAASQLSVSMSPIENQQRRRAAKTLFIELCSVRQCVVAVFNELKAGRTTLSAAVPPAAAALGMINEILLRFHATNPGIETFAQLRALCTLPSCAADTGPHGTQHCLQQPEDPINSDKPLDDDTLCNEAWKALIAGRCSLSASSKTSAEPTFSFMLQHLEAMKALVKDKSRDSEWKTSGWDPFATHLFAKLYNTAQPTPELVFFYQQFMDLHSTLSSQLSDLPGMAADCLLHVSTSIEQLSIAGQDNVGPLAGALNCQADAQAGVMRAIPRRSLSDAQVESQLSAHSENAYEPFLDFPAYASTLVGICLEEYQLRSWLHARVHGLFKIMAHLYRACKLAGFAEAHWKDMDFAIKNMPSTELEISDASTLLNCAKDYGIAMGVEQKQYRARTKEFRKMNGIMSDIRLPLPLMMESTTTDEIDESLQKYVVYVPLAQAMTDNKKPPAFLQFHVTRTIWEMIEPDGTNGPSKVRTVPEVFDDFSSLMDSRQLGLYFDYGGPFLLLCRDILLSVTSTTGTATPDEVHRASPTKLRDSVDDLLWGAAKDEDSEDPITIITHTGINALREAGRRMDDLLIGKKSQAYDRAVALTNIKLTDYSTPKPMPRDTTRPDSFGSSAKLSAKSPKHTSAATRLEPVQREAVSLPQPSDTAHEKYVASTSDYVQGVRISQHDKPLGAFAAFYTDDVHRTESVDKAVPDIALSDANGVTNEQARTRVFLTAASVAREEKKELNIDPYLANTIAREEAPVLAFRSTNYPETLASELDIRRQTSGWSSENYKGARYGDGDIRKTAQPASAIPFQTMPLDQNSDQHHFEKATQSDTPASTSLPDQECVSRAHRQDMQLRSLDELHIDREEMKTLLVQIWLLVLVHIWIIMLLLAALWALTMALFSAFVVHVILLYWQ